MIRLLGGEVLPLFTRELGPIKRSVSILTSRAQHGSACGKRSLADFMVIM